MHPRRRSHQGEVRVVFLYVREMCAAKGATGDTGKPRRLVERQRSLQGKHTRGEIL